MSELSIDIEYIRQQLARAHNFAGQRLAIAVALAALGEEPGNAVDTEAVEDFLAGTAVLNGWAIQVTFRGPLEVRIERGSGEKLSRLTWVCSLAPPGFQLRGAKPEVDLLAPPLMRDIKHDVVGDDPDIPGIKEMIKRADPQSISALFDVLVAHLQAA